MTRHLYIPASTWPVDPIGTRALQALGVVFFFAGIGGFLSIWGY